MRWTLQSGCMCAPELRGGRAQAPVMKHWFGEAGSNQPVDTASGLGLRVETAGWIEDEVRSSRTYPDLLSG